MDTTGKVDADLDTRLDVRFMDIRRLRTTSIFRIRNLLLKSIREYLDREGFVEITTPKVVATATEGGLRFSRSLILNAKHSLTRARNYSSSL